MADLKIILQFYFTTEFFERPLQIFSQCLEEARSNQIIRQWRFTSKEEMTKRKFWSTSMKLVK